MASQERSVNAENTLRLEVEPGIFKFETRYNYFKACTVMSTIRK